MVTLLFHITCFKRQSSFPASRRYSGLTFIKDLLRLQVFNFQTSLIYPRGLKIFVIN